MICAHRLWSISFPNRILRRKPLCKWRLTMLWHYLLGYNLKISFEGLSLSLSLSSFWIFQRKGNRTNFRRTTTWWRTCRVWSRLSLVCLYSMGTAIIMWLVSIKFKTIGLDWSVNITRSLIKIPKDKRNWLLNAVWTTEKP